MERGDRRMDGFLMVWKSRHGMILVWRSRREKIEWDDDGYVRCDCDAFYD